MCLCFTPSPFPLDDAIVRRRSNEFLWKVPERLAFLAVFAPFREKIDLEKQREKTVKENIRTLACFPKGVGQRKTKYSIASVSFKK